MSVTKETLIEARDDVKPQTALITLKSQFNPRSKKIWIIVEGKTDPCYYLNTIENVIPAEWKVVPVEAGNKNTVIAVFNSLDWHKYDKKKILFFVDRDLSDFIDDVKVKSANIYITDGYSIENSLISEYVIQRVLRELLGLNNINSNEIMSINSLFQRAKSLFIKTMTITMGIILCIREHNIPIDGLNTIEIKKKISFSKGECSLKLSLQGLYDYVIKQLNCKDSFSKAEYEASKAKFSFHRNHKNLIRGKYMLSFLVLFLISIRDDWEKIVFAKTRAKKRSITLGIDNAFENVAVRARTVPSLRRFYMKSIIGKWLK